MLKQALATAPVLTHYNPELPTRVETNTSDRVVAAVLSQLYNNGEWHPISYYSASISPAEHNYNIHNKEMLAIIKAFQEWRPELIGLRRQERFEILSDHRALEYFMTTKALSARQVHWYEFLQEFYFILHYRPGKANVLADTLTRRKDENARNLDHQNLTLLPTKTLDQEILAELAIVDLEGTIEEHNIINKVLKANKAFANTETARNRLRGENSD